MLKFDKYLFTPGKLKTNDVFLRSKVCAPWFSHTNAYLRFLFTPKALKLNRKIRNSRLKSINRVWFSYLQLNLFIIFELYCVRFWLILSLKYLHKAGFPT